jgi:PAS domain S-box-containing protein
VNPSPSHPDDLAARRAAPARSCGDSSGRHASDERLRWLIESATDYAIFSTDPQRCVDYWNSGAERVFGWTEREMIGQTADIIFTAEDRARGEPEREAALALQHGRAEDERWHARKDESRFYASGVMAPLRADDGSLRGFVKIARDLTERKVTQDKLRAAREDLETRVRERTAELRAANDALHAEILQREESEKFRKDVLRRIVTAQEDERLRLSRELHDVVSQHLAALMLGLNSLETYLQGGPGAPVLTSLQSLTETIGREIHELAVTLRPTALDDLGLVRAITNYVEAWSVRTGIDAQLHTAGLGPARLPAEVEIALYRIAQEALTNVLKHAAARRVSVVLNRFENEISLVIEDDGRGFESDAKPASAGLGLLGMSERVRQLGGRITVESAVGQGTTILVRIPVP